MKLRPTLAALAASTLASQAVTEIIDTTTNSYSIEDRGNFSLTDTGQTFTTSSLGADNVLTNIQLQQSRDFQGGTSGDNISVEIWTDSDGNQATWDPGTKLGDFTSAPATFDSPLAINRFSFSDSGITLSDDTVYAIRYLSDDASGDSLMRIAVTKDSASPGAGGTYKNGTFFAGGSAPFGNGWDSGFSVTTSDDEVDPPDPVSFTQSVTFNGETITMQLTKQNLRGENFELWTQNASGGYDAITPVIERSYLGTVDEYPGAVSCGILQDNGIFRGAVYFDRGVTWFTLGDSVNATRALDYADFSDFTLPNAATVSAGHAGPSMLGYELAMDAANNYVNANGSVAKTFEMIEYSVAVTRAIYMRDLLLRPYLGRVILRTTANQSPYRMIGASAGNDYLAAVKTEWNENQADVSPAVVAGVSTNKVGGGLAFVGVVGGTGKYAVNQSGDEEVFDVVLRHEMAHVWGSGHNVGGAPEGAGIMGGNAPGRFSGPEVEVILNHRDTRLAFVENEGAFSAVELPPYASLDVEIFAQGSDTSIILDVLANDHDANGQTITILDHDSTSASGGTITQDGQALLYTAPNGYLGADNFSYTATDSAGQTATGIVVIEVEPAADLRLYLPLDETSGTNTSDESVFKNLATLSGTTFSADSTSGKFGNAIELDGVDDHVEITEMNLESNTATMTAWVRQGATQNSFAGIIFDNAGPAAGLNIGNGTELRYHWDGNVQHWRWDSGLAPPADTWTFVALVIEPEKATMYMNTGNGFQSATNIATHFPVKFTTTYVGWEPSRSVRHFDGAIDEARIYNKALTQAELRLIFEGGGAESPDPANGATDVTSSLLKWTPGAAAISNNVYLGTSESEVTNATTASPEFAGNSTDPQFQATLEEQVQYFWRVDTITASGTLTGPTWTFTTGVPPEAILLNFGEDGNQNLIGGEPIGPTEIDSSNWNNFSGATGNQNDLINSDGTATETGAQWFSANTWRNNDGTATDEQRLAVGYLDDGDGTNGDGKGVLVTLTDIPYSTYRVYGLFASDSNQNSGTTNIRNFNVNGTWALGGNASTSAQAWSTIAASKANTGSAWSRIIPGSARGNYWVVNTSGPTCTIIGETRNFSGRGSLTGVIIEDTSPPSYDAPTGFTATASDSQVELTWNPEPNAIGYTIHRATSSGGPFGLLESDVQTTNFIDIFVTNGTPYFYTVSSLGPAGESDPSEVITATPLPALDAWRLENFRTTNNSGNAADDADPDHDGANNLAEFIAGTDPNDSTSRHHISSIIASGNDYLINFPTVTGKTYRVEWSDSLQPDSWTVASTEGTPQENIPGTNNIIQVTDSNGANQPRRFYRVVVE